MYLETVLVMKNNSFKSIKKIAKSASTKVKVLYQKTAFSVTKCFIRTGVQ